MPEPKNSSKKAQNFGSRKSKGKEDFLGKKKTKVEKETKKKKTKSKKETKSEKAKEKETQEKVKVKTEQEIEKIKEEMKKKAKKLQEKIEKEEKVKDLKEEVKEGGKEEKKKRGDTLFPLDDYVKYSSHLGTKAVTPHMRKFVYKRRADGLAVLNTNSIDGELKKAIEFLKEFKVEDIFLACKRESGWQAAKKFGEVTGIRIFTKKYPAGIITNPQLDDFFETELVIICDPWLDKNALNDSVRMKKPVIGLCDTNNFTKGITKVVPCNNKAAKSIGLILYLIAREYLKAKKEKITFTLEDFTGEIEIRERVKSGAKEGV
jgi:small subunit ribosomal protein S2